MCEMKRKRDNVNETGESYLERPTSLNLDTQVMDTSCHDELELIDLPTRKFEMSALTETLAVVARKIDIERCSKYDPRLSILPSYPMSDLQDHQYLLLTNIPSHHLTETELARRFTGTFKPVVDIIDPNSTIPSFLREKYNLYFDDLLERLKVDTSILDYNYVRLNQYMKMLICEQIQIFNLRPNEIQYIDENEYPLALEFYLQFDIHLFYMKTCSFRLARPRSVHEGLFCLHEPEARYELAACGNCGLCYPQYDMKYRLQPFIVDFNHAHQHTFVNGYRTILNCSASCHTRNIIYVLTCPCGTVDYIGTTKYSLPDRLKKHREHGNRIMHEFLLGQENINRNSVHGKTYETLRKDRMRLYQHSARCPVAMQIFLDANPQYWRFIPMSVDESERPEQQSIQQNLLSSDMDAHLRTKEDCLLCLQAVPKPPTGFTFSNRQILLQTHYFQKKRDQTLPNQHIDLYNASIVALLPETCSHMFRHTIESLFVTYGQTNLNTVGNVLNHEQRNLYYPLNNPWLIRGDEWCQGLERRPQPKPILLTTNSTSN